jgi:serine/threonine protein kinase
MGTERRTIDARITRGRLSNKEDVEGGEGGSDGEKVRRWPGPTSVDYADICAALSRRVQSGQHELFVFDSTKLIGHGASCKVYRAGLYGVVCATKVLSSSFVAKGSKAEKQFVAEIDILTSCKHENICRLYASSTNGDHKCAVLELMDISLEQRLIDSEYPPLSWEQRMYIALCMFRGVVALHSMRPVQIHRDIKTSNILLNGFKTSTLHPDCIAKVSDFGTVRAFDQSASVSTPLRQLPQNATFSVDITHANLTENVVGTYPYMPNECK